jgi:hypothetical protein
MKSPAGKPIAVKLAPSEPEMDDETLRAVWTWTIGPHSGNQPRGQANKSRRSQKMEELRLTFKARFFIVDNRCIEHRAKHAQAKT